MQGRQTPADVTQSVSSLFQKVVSLEGYFYLVRDLKPPVHIIPTSYHAVPALVRQWLNIRICCAVFDGMYTQAVSSDGQLMPG